MLRLILFGFCSFCFSVLLTPLCRDLFRYLGIVDRPDQSRKIHAAPVPHMGGVPLLLSYALTCLLMLEFPPSKPLWEPFNFSILIWAAPAVGMMFVTGILDDLYHLDPWYKLIGQFAAAEWAYMAGIRISAIGGHPLPHLASIILTIVWLIGCANAFNLIDGVDGLASGVGLFATATTLVAAILQHNMLLALATAPLAGALLGFLRYNFNPASIFLGDSGSLVIGFSLGALGIIWSQKAATILGMTAPLLALFIPILDTCLSIGRRFLRHQPIFGADGDHIHHRLLKRGFTARRVALVFYLFAAVGATLSILQSVIGDQWGGAVILVFCAATWIGVQHLGYTEFGAAGKMLLSGTFRQALDAQLRLRTLESDLGGAASLDRCWALVIDAARAFGFSEVTLKAHGATYHECFEIPVHSCWNISIPLPSGSSITLSRPYESPAFSMAVAPFVDSIRKVLSAKVQEFDQQPRTPNVTAMSRAR